MKMLRAIFSNKIFLSFTLLFLPIVHIVITSSLLIGWSISRWHLPLAILILSIIVYFLHKDESLEKGKQGSNRQDFFQALISFLSLFVLAVAFASLFFDLGYDSRNYHTKSILGLLSGENPFLDPSKWSADFNYPGAHWFISAALIKWTKSLETGFSLDYIMAIVAALSTFRFLSLFSNISRKWRLFLSILIVFNPTAIEQFFYNYVDGFLISTLLSLFMTMLLFIVEKNPRERFRCGVYICALLILVINTKFTGLVYGGVLGLTALSYGWSKKVSVQRLLSLASIGAGGLILATLLFGFYPYVTNSFQHKNPFHPAISFDEKGNKNNIIQQFYNPDFNSRSRYGKLWISLFSKGGDGTFNRVPVPLPPFSSTSTFSLSYGFGSFFGGTILLCLTLVLFIRDKSAWVIIGGVILSIFSTEANFDARLTPQIWWFPLLILAFFKAGEKKESPEFQPPRMMAQILAFLLLLTSLGYLGERGLIRGILESVQIRMFISRLEREGGWHGTYDMKNKEGEIFYNYYASGLTNIKIPMHKFCPPKAEYRRLPIQRGVHGIGFCRMPQPQNTKKP